jgi:hypothetical protein
MAEQFAPTYQKLCQMVLALNQQRTLALSLCPPEEIVFKRGKAYITLRGVSAVSSYRDIFRFFSEEIPSFDLRMTTSTAYEPQHTIVVDVPVARRWALPRLRAFWLGSGLLLLLAALLYQASAHYFYDADTNRHPAEQLGHRAMESLMALQNYLFSASPRSGAAAGAGVGGKAAAAAKNLHDLYNS